MFANRFRTHKRQPQYKALVLSHLPSATIAQYPENDELTWRVRYDFGWVGSGGRTPYGAWSRAWRACCSGRVPRQVAQP